MFTFGPLLVNLLIDGPVRLNFAAISIQHATNILCKRRNGTHTHTCTHTKTQKHKHAQCEPSLALHPRPACDTLHVGASAAEDSAHHLGSNAATVDHFFTNICIYTYMNIYICVYIYIYDVDIHIHTVTHNTHPECYWLKLLKSRVSHSSLVRSTW